MMVAVVVMMMTTAVTVMAMARVVEMVRAMRW